jgi:hypothetical protein
LSHYLKDDDKMLFCFVLFRALYNGLAAGLQRQMAFSAIRIGAYETVKKTYQDFTGCEFLLFPFKTNVTSNTGIPPSGFLLFLFLNS